MSVQGWGKVVQAVGRNQAMCRQLHAPGGTGLRVKSPALGAII